MKYAGMPMGMWALFAGSFRRELTAVFGYDAAAAKEITKNAKPRYRKIIAGQPFQNEHRELCDAVRVRPQHAAAPGRAASDGLLCKVYDNRTHALVLPQEREEQVL